MQFPDADTPVDPWLWSQVSQSGNAQDYVAFLDHAYEVDEAPVMDALGRAQAPREAFFPESSIGLKFLQTS
jgi:hypothetical protein